MGFLQYPWLAALLPPPQLHRSAHPLATTRIAPTCAAGDAKNSSSTGAGIRAGGFSLLGGRARRPSNDDESGANDGTGDGTGNGIRIGSGQLLLAAAAWGAGSRLLRKSRPLPVVLVHGILDEAESMEEAAAWVRRALGKGSYVRCVEVGNGIVDSWSRSMGWQLEQLAEQLQADRRLAKGFHMIGHSQGALLARGYVQRYNAPRVHTLVSWVGPQAGQFGVPDWEANWPNAPAQAMKVINQVTSSMWCARAARPPPPPPIYRNAHRLRLRRYTPLTQARVSFSNYWRDPLRLPLYREKSTFLADLNNELVDAHGRPAPNRTYAKRLRSLKAFVLVISSDDTIIVPRESSWFGFYAPNSTEQIVPLQVRARLPDRPARQPARPLTAAAPPAQRSPLYTSDLIGLRALDRGGRLHFAACDCKHIEVPTERCRLQVWDQATRRFLLPQGALAGLMRYLRPDDDPEEAHEGRERRFRRPGAHESDAVVKRRLGRAERALGELSGEVERLRSAVRQRVERSRAAKPWGGFFGRRAPSTS